MITIGVTAAVETDVAPGAKFCTGIEWSPADEVVILPKESFLNFIEVRSSSDPAVLTALEPLTWSLTVPATALSADCLYPAM